MRTQCAFDWSVEGTKWLPRTDESVAAVLDIFNKLKPRYKKNNVHFIPPSLPSSTYYSFYELIPTSFYFFPTIQTEDQCWMSNHSPLIRSDPAEAGRLTHRAESCLGSRSQSHVSAASLFPWTPNTPPDKTHTCYMSAGTSDKTEGLDWDKVHQRPQSTFLCWVLLDVDQSCWFTRQCYFYSRHITSPIMSLA